MLHILAMCQVFQTAADNGAAAFTAACEQYGAPTVVDAGAASGGVDVSEYGFAVDDSEDSDGDGMDVEAELRQLRREASDAGREGLRLRCTLGVTGNDDTGDIVGAPVVYYGQACIYRGIDALSPVVRDQVLAPFQAAAQSGGADISAGGPPSGAGGAPTGAAGSAPVGVYYMDVHCTVRCTALL
ncbi:hypothetical protein CYMTET_45360 [Cymbomonas tetramitiformis]|uniref:Uncharacterized protein n=1 Tax=Cymbomonas tetramitiformis TaxID=36881 RepID=A0AAE0C064_9CHLO|nr:hypothetical protein CYMTET_45360 [Cymbomonas tetramitiformis]